MRLALQSPPAPKLVALWFVSLVAGVLGTSVIVRAQAASAALQGTVVDESMAIVPDARVSIVNLETGHERSTVAGARGLFGRYRVAAQHHGFVRTAWQLL